MPAQPLMLPEDEYNQSLISNVHPPDWVNPTPSGRYNLVVIGAGAGGLVSAGGAAGLGGKVAIIEKHLLGGDCLNVGCVPSKALIRSAEIVAEIRQAEKYGIQLDQASVQTDFATVMERMRKQRAKIGPHDSAKRFTELGVDVFFGEAHFVGPQTIEVGGERLSFKKAIIATGGRPRLPEVPGLADIGYLTNVTVFELTEQPKKLAVIGAGPIGCELAQTFRRLGSEVVLIQSGKQILPREDADAAAVVQAVFDEEGIETHLNARLSKAEQTETGHKRLFYKQDGQEHQVEVDQVLVAIGRVPNVENLGLEVAGVDFNQHGVQVNDYLQTSNPNVYAVGDICLALKFTHASDASARVALRNALFKGHSKWSDVVIPRSTYTDPEIAHVGLTPDEAKAQNTELVSYQKQMSAVDRGITDGVEHGFAKIHVKPGSDKILGATLVTRHAGEMLNEITLAMTHNLGLSKIAETVHPYPTQAEIIKHLADEYNRTKLTPLVKKAFDVWLGFTR